MATPPTYPTTADLVEGTGVRSFGAVTTQAGDYIVVEGVGADGVASSITNLTPAATGLTFIKQTDLGSAGHLRVQQWTALDATGGSRTVQVTPGGGGNELITPYYAHLTVVRGSAGPSGIGTALSAQTVSVTRTGDNSGMFEATGDWSTGAVGAPVWTPGGATIQSQQGTGATYIFGRWNDSGAAGTASHGITSPTYTTPSIAVLEMLGIAVSTADLPTSRRPVHLFVPGPHPGTPLFPRRPRFVETAAASGQVTAEGGPALLGFTASGIAKKVAPQAGPGTLGLAATGTAAHVGKPAGTSALGLAGTGTAKKVVALSGTCALGLAGSGAAAKKAPQAGPAALGLAGAATDRKVAVERGTTTLGLAATAADAKRAPQAGLAALGLAGTRTSGPPVRAAAGAGYLGFAASGIAVRIGRAAGTATVGLAGSAGQRKIARPNGTAALGVAGSGTQRHVAKPAGTAALGLAAAGSAVKRAVSRGLAVLGLAPSGSATRGSGQVEAGNLAVTGDRLAASVRGDPLGHTAAGDPLHGAVTGDTTGQTVTGDRLPPTVT